MLKIIAGNARGVTLEALPGLDIRPTTERVRKALCDSLRDFAGLSVADLYAGTGAWGLEAASRGAAAVLLVEQNRRHCEVIKRNLESVKKRCPASAIELRCAAVGHPESYCAALPRPDLLFADPPYAESAAEYAKLMQNERFIRWASGALLLWEMPSEIHDYQGFLDVKAPGKTGFRRHEGMTFLEIRLD